MDRSQASGKLKYYENSVKREYMIQTEPELSQARSLKKINLLISLECQMIERIEASRYFDIQSQLLSDYLLL